MVHLLEITSYSVRVSIWTFRYYERKTEIYAEQPEYVHSFFSPDPTEWFQENPKWPEQIEYKPSPKVVSICVVIFQLVFQSSHFSLIWYLNHRDKSNSLLAYVYYRLPADKMLMAKNVSWLLFNEQLIKYGYAKVYPKFPFNYLDRFRRYQHHARLDQRGLWAEKPSF